MIPIWTSKSAVVNVTKSSLRKRLILVTAKVSPSMADIAALVNVPAIVYPAVYAIPWFTVWLISVSAVVTVVIPGISRNGLLTCNMMYVQPAVVVDAFTKH